MLEQPGLHSETRIHIHTKMQITSAARSKLDGHNMSLQKRCVHAVLGTRNMSGICLLNRNKLNPSFHPNLSKCLPITDLKWMENAIQNISGPDTSMTKTSGITYSIHPWMLRVTSTLSFMKWLLSYARVLLRTLIPQPPL